MDKSQMTKWLKSVHNAASKHSPEILTGIGIAGMITTVVLAVKATPKALTLIEEEKRRKSQDAKEVSLKRVEVVKAAWKPYVPSAIMGTLSVACLIGASSVNLRRNAALATAYNLSKTALADYKEKVVEVVGEEKEKEVREKVSEKKLKEMPSPPNEIIITGDGDVRFFDPLTGRPFWSNIEKVKSSVNELNKEMLHDMFGYISVNDFYDELGLDHVEVIGEDLGWNLNNGLIDIEFHSKITDDGKPCVVLYYANPPIYNYKL